MSLRKQKLKVQGAGRAFSILMTLLWVLRAGSSLAAQGQQSKRPFTVADDIGFAHFVSTNDSYGSAYLIQTPAQFSPNGEFLAVLTARGRLDRNEVEETLRFYRTKDIEAFLQSSADAEPPKPIWVVNRSDKKETINDCRWLGDSSGVALLEIMESGYRQRIVLADLGKKSTEVLVDDAGMWGDSFDITSRGHYVYFAADEAARKEAEKTFEERKEAERRAPMKVFSGSVWDLVLPEVPGGVERLLANKKRLWLVDGGKRNEVKYNGAPLTSADFSPSTLFLSPDGQSLITKLRVKSIPETWEKLYPPPYPTAPYNEIHAGGSAFQYARMDLKTGSAQPVTDAPVSGDAGWQEAGDPSWSSDGKSILVPDTFLKSEDGKPSRPCVAVVDLASDKQSCVERLKGHKGAELGYEEGFHYISAEQFVAGDKNLVELFYSDGDGTAWTSEYRRKGNNDWQVAWQSKGTHEFGPNGLQLTVRQGLNDPPVLVASNGRASRVILDPNPQFQDIELGQAKVYKWRDKDGKQWVGGLYLPVGYQAGKRYPLVIQTHGFTESAFLPSGSFPTAFAAREFAAAGIAVLQVTGGVCAESTSSEGPCNREGFEAGAKQLVAEGLVDPQNVGYIGFSRTCYHGMELLANGTLPLKAALLADGITGDFFDFTLFGLEEFNQLVGAKPFGDGLETWVKRSPGFHLDRVTAPVEIASEKLGVIQMWQPYALLRYLHRPVELTLMNSDEHVMTNPAERMASQGLSVDWFRFWMQGYEDSDPAKAEQYRRWQELRKIQEESSKGK